MSDRAIRNAAIAFAVIEAIVLAGILWATVR